MINKKGQVTVFIIIAILIVALAVLVFAFKDEIKSNRMPSQITPVYRTFSSCLEQDLELGANLLESQGGYIYLPEYQAGSEYMPFGSQLNFLGNPIPYWYYVSGNNIEREQVPTKEEMQNQLERFIELRVRNCLFDEFYDKGYEIVMDEPNSDITINSHDIVLNLNMNFAARNEEQSYSIDEHKIIINSELGALYDSALEVYNYEQEKLFLENYAIDTLRLYAPVDGVEMTCSPMVWRANNIFSDLSEAIELNTQNLKNENSVDEYFNVGVPNIPSEHQVNFINSRDWTYSFEVLPSEDNGVMIANPVGNQQGLGILGFCYVSYHFVYNVKYPILVQVSDKDEIFQFPLAVIIQRNMPRETANPETADLGDNELCKEKNTQVNVAVFDSDLNPLNAQVSYECLGTECFIGETEKGKLTDDFPQCINGYLTAKADGYKEANVLYSTVNGGSVSIYLSKIYTIPLQLKLDNQNYAKNAVIYFTSDDFSRVVSYPEQKEVELAEGEYEVQVYIYKNSSLELGESSERQCVDVPQSSIGGILGLTKKECFDVKIPAQIISNALAGGGKVNSSFSEDKLNSGKTLIINAESLPSPDTLEKIQENYLLFETKELGVTFK